MPIRLIICVIDVLRVQEVLGIYEMIGILNVIEQVTPGQLLALMKLSEMVKTWQMHYYERRAFVSDISREGVNDSVSKSCLVRSPVRTIVRNSQLRPGCLSAA